jgi:hypothetical protein
MFQDSERTYYSIETVVDNLDLATEVLAKILAIMDQSTKLKYITVSGRHLASGRHILYALMAVAAQEAHDNG